MIDFDAYDKVRAIRYVDTALELLDQRLLPKTETWVRCETAESVADAIRSLVVRGAPAIGIAAAYGICLAARAIESADPARIGSRIPVDALKPAFDLLAASRPTAVNLFWSLARMRRVAESGADLVRLETEARAIESEDLAANRHMGELGAALIGPDSGIVTHCNTGSLATAGFGTALGVIRAAYAQGKVPRVYAGETRPWMQGSRLTVWELLRDEIPAKLMADSAAAHLMSTGTVKWVVVGADRIAANGDTANKIGTYALAIAAKHHGLKFMVVAPSSTVDMKTASGKDIHIELRDPKELLEWGGSRVVAEGVEAWNPVFDVTPGSLIDAIVTEKGVVEKPDRAKMEALFG